MQVRLPHLRKAKSGLFYPLQSASLHHSVLVVRAESHGVLLRICIMSWVFWALQFLTHSGPLRAAPRSQPLRTATVVHCRNAFLRPLTWPARLAVQTDGALSCSHRDAAPPRPSSSLLYARHLVALHSSSADSQPHSVKSSTLSSLQAPAAIYRTLSVVVTSPYVPSCRIVHMSPHMSTSY